MGANDKQVGGDHYKTGIQHWDMLLEMGFSTEYYVGQFTKYITRWRKKHGIRDLRKGLHFLEKMIEVVNEHPEGEAWLPMWGVEEDVLQEDIVAAKAEVLDAFFSANDVGEPERLACVLVLFAHKVAALTDARDTINKLIVDTMAKGGEPGLHDGDRPVSTNFEFIEYSDEGNYMKWRCKECGGTFVLSSDEPPKLHHACPVKDV